MNDGITVIEKEHAPAVNALRVSEYAGARGFKVAPEGILWNRSDDESIVLGAWSEGELVATMRLELVASPELLERKLECPWSYPVALEFPVMVLSKAATRASHRGSGLNAALRCHALELARFWGVRHVVGTFVAGSPRARTMADMGYRFFDNPEGWNRADYRSTAPVVVALLDLTSDGERALEVARDLARDTLDAFRWSGPRPEPKIVTVIK